MSKKVRRCVICGIVLPKGEYGNNPEPIKPFSSGVCCNECNMSQVIPARLAGLKSTHKVENTKEQSEVKDE